MLTKEELLIDLTNIIRADWIHPDYLDYNLDYGSDHCNHLLTVDVSHPRGATFSMGWGSDQHESLLDNREVFVLIKQLLERLMVYGHQENPK